MFDSHASPKGRKEYRMATIQNARQNLLEAGQFVSQLFACL